jgi:hypothetical protein
MRKGTFISSDSQKKVKVVKTQDTAKQIKEKEQIYKLTQVAGVTLLSHSFLLASRQRFD